MPIKLAYGNRVYVRCPACKWEGVRKQSSAKTKPCPRCKGSNLKFIDVAQDIDRRRRVVDTNLQAHGTEFID